MWLNRVGLRRAKEPMLLGWLQRTGRVREAGNDASRPYTLNAKGQRVYSARKDSAPGGAGGDGGILSAATRVQAFEDDDAEASAAPGAPRGPTIVSPLSLLSRQSREKSTAATSSTARGNSADGRGSQFFATTKSTGKGWRVRTEPTVSPNAGKAKAGAAGECAEGGTSFVADGVEFVDRVGCAEAVESGDVRGRAAERPMHAGRSQHAVAAAADAASDRHGGGGGGGAPTRETGFSRGPGTLFDSPEGARAAAVDLFVYLDAQGAGSATCDGDYPFGPAETGALAIELASAGYPEGALELARRLRVSGGGPLGERARTELGVDSSDGDPALGNGNGADSTENNGQDGGGASHAREGEHADGDPDETGDSRSAIYAHLVASFCECGDADGAAATLVEMGHAEVPPSRRTVELVVRGLSMAARAEDAREVAATLPATAAAHGVVARSLVMAGDVAGAEDAMWAVSDGDRREALAAVVAGHCQKGSLNQAQRVVEDAIEAGVDFDENQVVALLASAGAYPDEDSIDQAKIDIADSRQRVQRARIARDGE